MKLTTKLIKQLIKEEMQQMPLPFEKEEQPPEAEEEIPRSVQDLRKVMRKLSGSSANFEGISADEAMAIYNLLLDLMQVAKDTNSTVIMNRIQQILEPQTGEV